MLLRLAPQQSLECPSDLYASLLQTSLKAKDGITGKAIHARVIKSGLHLGVFLMNNLVNFYAKTGFISDAHHLFDEMSLKNTFSWNTILSAYTKHGNFATAQRVFDEMPERDAVSWTCMIVGFNQMGRLHSAITMFLQMLSSRIQPTQFTFTNILSSCAALEDLSIGKKVHSFVVKSGLGSYVPVANSLLNMYGKSGDPATAKVVFDRMSLRSISSWNAMISLYTHCGRLDLALEQFEHMSDRDAVSWNSIIAGYNQHGFDREALHFFSKMLSDSPSSAKPDQFTFASVLSACANLEMLKPGKEIHGQTIRFGLNSNVPVCNALISMYCKSGGGVEIEIARKIVEKSLTNHLNIISFTALLDGYVKLGDVNPARRIFDSLIDRDVVAWTAMIVGYVQNGLNNDALELFRSMVHNGPKPNNYTLATMLSVCSSLASLDQGKLIHSTAIRSDEESSVSVWNTYINMYAKAGSIQNARHMFY